MKFTTAAQVLKAIGGLSILSSQGIIGVEAVSSIVCHYQGGLLLLFPLMCSCSWKRYSTQTSLYIIEMITISPTLLFSVLELCAHIRFSFVHHRL